MGRKRLDPIKNFFSKIKKTKTRCWEWTAKISKKTGYGIYSIYEHPRRIYYLAHRFSYIFHKGIIQKGKVIDHLCKNRLCVNPNHLEAVSLRENILRGNGFAATNHKKKHCLKGHEFTKQNTYITPDGRRQCRKCLNARSKNHRNRFRHDAPQTHSSF